MTDDRHPEKDRHPETPEGYFGWPEGDDAVKFLDEDGNPMTTEEWRRSIEENPVRYVGSGTKEDPYRLPGTAP